MPTLRERLHDELLKTSEGYRSLPPTEQANQIEDGIAELLETQHHELLEVIRGRLARLPPPPGKDDSWSW